MCVCFSISCLLFACLSNCVRVSFPWAVTQNTILFFVYLFSLVYHVFDFGVAERQGGICSFLGPRLTSEDLGRVLVCVHLLRNGNISFSVSAIEARIDISLFQIGCRMTVSGAKNVLRLDRGNEARVARNAHWARSCSLSKHSFKDLLLLLFDFVLGSVPSIPGHLLGNLLLFLLIAHSYSFLVFVVFLKDVISIMFALVCLTSNLQIYICIYNSRFDSN